MSTVSNSVVRQLPGDGPKTFWVRPAYPVTTNSRIPVRAVPAWVMVTRT
jgi:hypothetical protein